MKSEKSESKDCDVVVVVVAIIAVASQAQSLTYCSYYLLPLTPVTLSTTFWMKWIALLKVERTRKSIRITLWGSSFLKYCSTLYSAMVCWQSLVCSLSLSGYASIPDLGSYRVLAFW